MRTAKIGRTLLQVHTDTGDVELREAQEWLVRKRLPLIAETPQVLSVRVFRGLWAMTNNATSPVERNRWLAGHPRYLTLVRTGSCLRSGRRQTAVGQPPGAWGSRGTLEHL